MLKKLFLLKIILLFTLFGFSQSSNVIFFSEQGEQFYVVINGVKRNNDAQSNVKISDLNAPSYKCKIIFRNKALGQLDKTIYLNPGMEATYTIRKSKNKWIIRYMNETPIVYSNIPDPYINEPNLPPPPPQGGNNNVNNVNQTPQSGNVNQNNISLNLNINTGNINNGGNIPGNNNHPVNPNSNSHNNPHPSNHGQTIIVHAVPGYTGPYGCNYPMSPANFANVKSSISSKSFENSKLTIAKQVITNNCLTTAQIKEILRLFDFENTRLDFAIFAWNYTYDKGNYYMLNDAFDFEHSIEELDKYIKATK